jgi:hypothetical protein
VAQAMSELVNSPDLAAPVGFSHAVRAGDTVYLGGQVAQARDGAVVGETIAEQFDVAAGNLVTALRAAGGEPESPRSASTGGHWASSAMSGAAISAAAIRRWGCSASPSCLTPRPRWS